MSSESETTQPIDYHIRTALNRYLRDCEKTEITDLYQFFLHEVERPLFECVMQHCAQNQSRAATILGISRGTLRKKLVQYQLIQ
ncbi:MAG: Fis family transcriptional regulator [Gammaproteobacteria bacterium]|nr:Fis family transcriptional regulator [Gammaproteobacteria bacterium]